MMALTVSASILSSSGVASVTLRAARRDILITAFLACCRATAGLLNRRSSSTGILSSCSSSLLQGRKSSMAATLERVWMFAMELLFITSLHMGMPMVYRTR